MKCDLERLAGYVLGLLDDAGEAEVEAHVQTCPSCGQQLAELRATVALLEEEPQIENQPVDIERLRSAIASRRRIASPLGWIGGVLRLRWRWAVALAATACLAALCLHYGVAVRVGGFEIALGGARPTIVATQELSVRDIELLRRVAQHEIAVQVGPGLRELARYVCDLEARHRQELVALRNEFSHLRAFDREEVKYNLRLVADGMHEALSERHLGIAGLRVVPASMGEK